MLNQNQIKATKQAKTIERKEKGQGAKKLASFCIRQKYAELDFNFMMLFLFL